MSKLSNLIRGIKASWTVRTNTAVGAPSLLLWFLETIRATDFVSQDNEYTALVTGLVALVNVVLRFKTKKPLDQR